jgi:hypothetical protein
MGRVDPKKFARDMAARRRLASHATPGLPIDGDVVDTRVPMPSMGRLMDGLLASMLIEKSPFFDEVCEKWMELFPDSAAKPGRWQDGRLFLYVRTSGQLFGMRTKLPKIKKALAALPTAPRRFSVNLEIHAAP